MKAISINGTCEASDLHVSDVPVPAVKPGWVLIKVIAFGINHSEVLLRRFEADRPYIHTPIIPGIECIGVIADKSDSRFENGQTVMALMGGMGRSFNGSYAEYTLMPESNVFAVESDLPTDELAAIPETFFTAYGSLSLSLQLQAGDTLLIRGGSSTVGLAAIQLGKALGATVVAASRSPQKAEILRSIGADDVVLEGEDFRSRFLGAYPHAATKILELIGASTLIESLHITALHGIVCHTGLLGNKFSLNDFDPIKEIPSGVYLTGFYSNRPTQTMIDGMMKLINDNNIHPVIAGKFTLDNISQAHLLAEKRNQIGKIIVTA